MMMLLAMMLCRVDLSMLLKRYCLYAENLDCTVEAKSTKTWWNNWLLNGNAALWELQIVHFALTVVLFPSASKCEDLRLVKLLLNERCVCIYRFCGLVQ